MFTNIYEHHYRIKDNRQHPFLYHWSEFRGSRSRDISCNWHKNIELLLVEEGEGFIGYDTDELEVCGGDLILVNSGAMHRIYTATSMKFHCFIVDESFCNDNGIFTDRLRFTRVVRDEESCRRYRELIARIEARENEPFSVARIRSAALLLLIDLCTKHACPEEGAQAQKNAALEHVKVALSYLNENYAHAVSLEQVADEVGITKFHLAREFKRYTGQTVVTYLNMLRCKMARVYLSEGRNVTEAALESGFSSLSYFSRTYKKLMGQTPSEETPDEVDGLV